jgi:tetratricopeptide (TPR) repeat protein
MPTAIELYNEGDQLKAAGKLDEAVAKFEASLAADPSYLVAHSALAVTLQRLGKQEEAIAHAQKACELGPDDPFNFTAMSVTYQRAYAATGEMKYIPLAEEAMEKSRILQAGRR